MPPVENGLDPAPSPGGGGGAAAPETQQANEASAPDGVKKWERAWTIQEMRQNSKNWTLAADAGVSGECA